MYVKAFYDAAVQNEVVNMFLFDYGKLNNGKIKNHLDLRVEYHYAFGVHVLQLNKNLIKFVRNKEIDFAFFIPQD